MTILFDSEDMVKKSHLHDGYFGEDKEHSKLKINGGIAGARWDIQNPLEKLKLFSSI